MKLPKNIPTTAGIYAIHNIDKDRYYIGSSKNIRGRISQHLHQFKHHTHNNKQMNADYDTDQFEFLVLENVADTTLLLNRENYWYSQYMDKTYNLGIGGKSGPMKGPYTLTDSTTGQIYKHVLSLPEFYNTHDCPAPSTLLKLASGKATTICGWSCIAEHGDISKFSSDSYNKTYTYLKRPTKSTAKIKFTVLHIPTNTTYNVINIATFCSDHNLPIYTIRGRIERNSEFTYYDYKFKRV